LWSAVRDRYGAETPINERSVSPMNPMTIISVPAPFRLGTAAC
jgi:hypothetical protein